MKPATWQRLAVQTREQLLHISAMAEGNLYTCTLLPSPAEGGSYIFSPVVKAKMNQFDRHGAVEGKIYILRLPPNLSRAISTLLTILKSAMSLVATMFVNLISLFMVSVAGFMVEGRAATKRVRNMYRFSLFAMNRRIFAC